MKPNPRETNMNTNSDGLSVLANPKNWKAHFFGFPQN